MVHVPLMNEILLGPSVAQRQEFIRFPPQSSGFWCCCSSKRTVTVNQSSFSILLTPEARILIIRSFFESCFSILFLVERQKSQEESTPASPPTNRTFSKCLYFDDVLKRGLFRSLSPLPDFFFLGDAKNSFRGYLRLFPPLPFFSSPQPDLF